MPIEPPIGPKPPIGRGWLVDQIAALVDRGDVRLLTLTGLPGVGKTTVARRALVGRPHRWIPAGTLPGQMPPPDDVGAGDLVVVDGVGESDAQRRCLEQFLDRGVRTVVTARRPLRVRGEHVVRITPLPSPDPVAAAAALAEEPTVELFRHVAVRSGAALDWDDADLLAVAEIVRRVGGHPMAIELLAARTPAYSPTTIADQLSSGRGRAMAHVVDGAADLLDTIEWSSRQLAASATAVMTAMTVFEGPVPIDAIEHVLNDPSDELRDDLPDVVSDLVDAHLVDAVHEAGTSLYALPPLVDEVLRSRAADSDDTRHRKRRLEWAGVLAAETTAGSQGETGLPDVRLTLLEPDLTAALRDAVEWGDADAAADLTVALAPVWLARGVLDAEVALAERSVALADGLASRCTTALARGWLANLLAERVVVESDLARLVAERDRSLADAHDCEPIVVLRSLALAVRPARALDDRAEAIELARRGRELALDIGDHPSVVRFEVWLGMLTHQNDDVATAVAWGASALERARRSSDEPGMLAAAGLLRTVPRAYTETIPIPTLAELADTARRRRDLRTLTWVLPAAAVEAMVAGELERSLDLAEEALGVARRAGGWTWISGPPLAVVAGLTSRNAPAEVGATIYGVLAGQIEVFESSAPPEVVRGWRAAIEAVRRSPDTDVLAAFARGTMMTFDAAMTHATEAIRALRSDGATDGSDAVAAPELTAREIEVLRELANGGTNKDVAASLGIRPKTVMHHAAAIYRKLQVRGRGEAVAWWFQHRS